MLLPAAYAQTSQVAGTIRGIVTDQSGAVVGDADVTATNTGNNANATTKTNGQGEYVLPSLSAGMYSLSVRKAGFKEFLAKGVELHTSSITELNAQLSVGNATEVMTVEASGVQVQTTSASVGEVVDGRQVSELPLNGGNFVELTQLVPGVAAVGGPGGALNTKDKGILGGVDFAVNGNPSTNNLFLLDGANNNDKGSNRTILIYPAVDSIAEFKMLRNSYGPEYGQASGAIISIITKSGENAFHGSLNYFGRNDALNSYEFFAKRNLDLNGNPIKDKLRRNDVGYSIGGPIKKDKLFFFWSEEWNREIRGQTHHTCAPSAAELLGDFTTTSCGAAPNIPAGLQDPGNPQKIANPDPAGLLYAQMLPIKNLATPAPNGDNWFQSVPSKINWREENIRVDFNVTKKHMLTGKYVHDSWENPAPHVVAYWGDNQILPQLQGNWSQPSESAIGKLTSTFSSTLVNEAQFSYSHNAIVTTPGGLASDPAGLIASINAAIPTVYPANIKQKGGLPIFWGGFQQYGSASTTWLISPYSNSMDTYTINDDLTKVIGSHALKAGFLWAYSGKNEDQNGGYDQPAMAMADWGVFTPTGNGLANLLIPGQVFAGAQEFSVNPTDHARWHDVEFYVSDTWKARRNLTLEYGIRWSFLREPYELNNAMTSFSRAAYDPLKPNTDACNGVIIVPGTDPCGAANALNGTNFSSGTPGVNSALRKNDNNAIAPRLGVSWDPWSNGKTAVRLGVGQFFQSERVTPQVLMSANAPFSTNSIVNRSLGVAPPLAGVAASPGFGADPRARLPNAWQWNLTVERELAKDMTLELSYVGNRGIHLTSKFDLNQVVDPASRLQAAFTSGGGVNAFRPMSNDGTIVFFTREAWSNYHSLQALFRARIKDRLQLQAAYTWSHAIANTELDDSSAGTGGGVVASLFTDLSNLRLDKGNTTINRPNIFSANAILYLPYLKGYNSFVRNSLGGWEFSTIIVAQSGNSITVFDNGVSDANHTPDNPFTLSTLSGTGYAANQRPNVVPGVSCNSGSHGEQLLNPAAFTLNGYQIGTIGNESRGHCWGPNLINADLALYKNWSLTERFKLQFRLEMFNALNHAQFRGDQLNTTFAPSVTCGAAPVECTPGNNIIQTTGAPNQTFGQSTLTRGPREVQYGLKLTF
ncbi:MAG: carboxypeptidase regulatory-like domain-containing protein [Terriglobales bacterium]